MAKAILPTNFTDDVLNESMDGKRRYNMIPNADGSQSLEDVTEYDQLGSNFGASNINAMNQAINESFDKNKMISDMDELDAVTQSGYGVDALVVKEVNDSLQQVGLIKYYTFTGTTDSNGFVLIPNTVVRPSTGMVLSAVETTNPINVTFHYIIQATTDDYSVRCCYWDNTTGNNANKSKTIKIAYVLY